MNEIINEGQGHRTHIRSPLMRESLMDRKVLAASDTQAVLPILPDVHVVHLGGASILDRGKAALVPLLDEVVRCRKMHKIILGVGGGARMRHTYHIALDLGIPTGLRALGVTEDGLADLAEAASHDPCFATNPRPVSSREDVVEVLRSAL